MIFLFPGVACLAAFKRFCQRHSMNSSRSSSSEWRCTRRRKPTMRTQAGKWISCRKNENTAAGGVEMDWKGTKFTKACQFWIHYHPFHNFQELSRFFLIPLFPPPASLKHNAPNLWLRFELGGEGIFQVGPLHRHLDKNAGGPRWFQWVFGWKHVLRGSFPKCGTRYVFSDYVLIILIFFLDKSSHFFSLSMNLGLCRHHHHHQSKIATRDMLFETSSPSQWLKNMAKV